MKSSPEDDVVDQVIPSNTGFSSIAIAVMQTLVTGAEATVIGIMQ